MKDGRIFSVEYLSAKSDGELIAEARDLFLAKGLAQGAEGFEVWDHTRFIYRFVTEGTADTGMAKDGLNGPPRWWQRLWGKTDSSFSDLETMAGFSPLAA